MKLIRTFSQAAAAPVAKAILAAAILAGSSAFADDMPRGRTFQIHGFLSQAYLQSSKNNFFGESSGKGTFDFRELGINASWSPHSRILTAVQGVSRWAGEGDEGKPRIDYGFLDYKVLSEQDGALGIRMGRIINPSGLYNDTRDVAFTRPSILLPQSIYFDRVRDVALSSDGVQLYAESRQDLGDFSLQTSMARPRVKGEETELALMGRNYPGELQAATSYIWRLGYDKDGGLVRAGISGARVNIDYESGGSSDQLSDGDIAFSPLFFSAQYGPERWSLTAEYALRPFKLRNLGRLNTETTGESYYLQGTLTLLEDLEGIARYDVLYTDKNDRDGKEFEQATGGRAPAHSRFAKDLTLGLRYDLTPSIMLRGEFHNIDGTAWITRLDNPKDINETKRHWNLYSFLISFRF